MQGRVDMRSFGPVASDGRKVLCGEVLWTAERGSLPSWHGVPLTVQAVNPEAGTVVVTSPKNQDWLEVFEASSLTHEPREGLSWVLDQLESYSRDPRSVGVDPSDEASVRAWLEGLVRQAHEIGLREAGCVPCLG